MAYHGYTQDELTQLSKTIIERVSRFRKFLENLSSTPTVSERIELNMRMDRIRPLYEQFDEITLLLEKESLASNSRAEFENSYFRSLAIAEKISASGIIKMHERLDYEILNNKRISFKERIAGFNEYIREIKRKNLSSSQFLELQLSIDRVEPMFKQYEEIQLKLESVGLLDDTTAHFEGSFHGLLAIAKDLLCKENSKPTNTSN